MIEAKKEVPEISLDRVEVVIQALADAGYLDVELSGDKDEKAFDDLLSSVANGLAKSR